MTHKIQLTSILFAFVIAAMLALSGCCTNCDREGGVMLAHNLDEESHAQIESYDILDDDENVVAYYDATLSLDGTDTAILTDKRVISHFNGKNTAILLRDIKRIDHHEDVNDFITVVSNDGERIVIEIALFNGGHVFLNALKDEWDRTREGAASEG